MAKLLSQLSYYSRKLSPSATIYSRLAIRSFSSSVNSSLPIFEGPEKLMEFWFSPREGETADSLREITQERWQACLDSVNCEIISTIQNDHLTAYLLSESSLFVSSNRVYIKTCGTTTLLRGLPGIMELAASCNLHMVQDFFYSRQNLNFPEEQLYPHKNFVTEVDYLDKKFEEGTACTLGNYNFFYARSPNMPVIPSDASLEIMMTGLDDELMRRHFFKDNFDSRTFVASGLGALFPEALVDEYIFEPCGYSMNGILDDSFFTVHVTPQSDHSYASFETNIKLTDFSELLHQVLAIFRPREVMVVASCNDAYLESGKHPKACSYLQIGVPGYDIMDQAMHVCPNYDLNYAHFKAR